MPSPGRMFSMLPRWSHKKCEAWRPSAGQSLPAGPACIHAHRRGDPDTAQTRMD